jgi:hypothetical protein
MQISIDQVMAEALRVGQPVHEVVAELVQFTRQRQPDASVHIAVFLTRCTAALAKAGVALPKALEPLQGRSDSRAFVWVATRSQDQLDQAMQEMADFVEAHRAWLSFPEAPAPVEQQEPLKVQLVGMPTRQTLQTVERDQAGEIVGTLTTETDR